MKLDKIICPSCKAEILFIPDLKAMTTAIADHLKIDANEMKRKNTPNSEISRQKKEVENALIEEMVTEIYEKYAPSSTFSVRAQFSNLFQFLF